MVVVEVVVDGVNVVVCVVVVLVVVVVTDGSVVTETAFSEETITYKSF